MKSLDRTLGILLLLRSGRAVSAAELAARFEVTSRTIYRDIETLSSLGVPVAAEMGRKGGFRLHDGYFLPPVTLGTEEAVSLLLGLVLMRRLRVMPFPAEADFAERKLLAALPAETRATMERASRFIGFERVPADLLHPEYDDPLELPESASRKEGVFVGRFLKALLSRARVTLTYHSPYREREEPRELEPRCLLWDRDRWYLVGAPPTSPDEYRMFRADRVLELGPGRSMSPVHSAFDADRILERKWLRKAMDRWRTESPVRIALRPEQAERLKRDWYYGNALFEADGKGRTVMTYGESSPENAAELVRWLGPGAELLEPEEWRNLVAASLLELFRAHEN